MGSQRVEHDWATKQQQVLPRMLGTPSIITHSFSLDPWDGVDYISCLTPGSLLCFYRDKNTFLHTRWKFYSCLENSKDRGTRWANSLHRELDMMEQLTLSLSSSWLKTSCQKGDRVLPVYCLFLYLPSTLEIFFFFFIVNLFWLHSLL